MAYDPERNSEPKRALRAGLIAIARGSQVIELEDWLQAATARTRRLSVDDWQKLEEVLVSDEVVMRVADERSKAKASEVERGGLAGRLARIRARQSHSTQE